jgi:hypothetical protein
MEIPEKGIISTILTQGARRQFLTSFFAIDMALFST